MFRLHYCIGSGEMYGVRLTSKDVDADEPAAMDYGLVC